MADKGKIPGSITPEDFMELRKILTRVLEDMGAQVKSAGALESEMPKEVHVRLNETGKDYPYPLFVGWVEDKKLAEKRSLKNHPDPGLYRFADDVLSNVYAEAFWSADKGNYFQWRDWETQMDDKRPAEKGTDPKSGNLYQTCLGIVVDEGKQYRVVGTLVVGFAAKPRARIIQSVHGTLRLWGRPPSLQETRRRTSVFESPLLTFLMRYELGGRILKLKPNRRPRTGRR
jgi:hypothetical protein